MQSQYRILAFLFIFSVYVLSHMIFKPQIIKVGTFSMIGERYFADIYGNNFVERKSVVLDCA